MRTPSPPPRPEPIELISVEHFSVESLNKMLNQVYNWDFCLDELDIKDIIIDIFSCLIKFKQVAPEGLVAIKTFIEIFNELVLLNYGNETLPEQWLNLSQNQVGNIIKEFKYNSGTDVTGPKISDDIRYTDKN